MPREEKLKIYWFEELSKEAKKRAIEDFRSNPDLTWDDRDSEMLTEQFEEDLNEHYGLGKDMKANWGLSYVQGDGVCFEGWVDLKKFIETEGSERFKPLIGLLRAKITNSGRSCHYASMSVEADWSGEDLQVIPRALRQRMTDWEWEKNSALRRWHEKVREIAEQRMAP